MSVWTRSRRIHRLRRISVEAQKHLDALGEQVIGAEIVDDLKGQFERVRLAIAAYETASADMLREIEKLTGCANPKNCSVAEIGSGLMRRCKL